MARTSNLANVATVSRASKAWYPGGWDFTDGGAITGDLVEYANNTARDGSSGLLVEESSTNEIRNPRAEGAAAGTPGTAPTNWSVRGQSTTTSIVGSGDENGWPYVDVRFNGTPTSDPSVGFEADGTVGASQSETWTLSVGARLVGGDLTNVSGVKLGVDERSTVFETGQQSATKTLSSSHTRVYFAATLSDADTTSITPYIFIDWDGSGAIDITLRIYAPQLENKAYPTSPILPPASSPAASDREADDIIIADGAWGADSGDGFSAYIEADMTRPTSAQSFDGLLDVGEGDTNNNILVNLTSAGDIRFTGRDGGVAQVAVNVGSYSAVGDTVKVAFAWAQDDFAGSANGATQVTDTSATHAYDPVQIGVGQRGDGAKPAGAYIKQIRYWPRRLTNAELEALVGN